MKKVSLLLFCTFIFTITSAQKTQFGLLAFEVPVGFRTDKNNNTLYVYNTEKQLCAVIYSSYPLNGNMEETIWQLWNNKERFINYTTGEITNRYSIESGGAKGIRADYVGENENGRISKTVLAFESGGNCEAVIVFSVDDETKLSIDYFLKSIQFIAPRPPVQLTELQRSYNWYKALRGPDASNSSIQTYQSQTSINFTGFNAASQNHLQKLGDSLFYLRELPNLQTIYIGQTRLNDAAAMNIGLLPAIKNVQSIDQGLAMPITNAGFTGLSRAGSLEIIDLRAVEIPGATDASLSQLARLTRLKKLILSRATAVTISGFEQLTPLKQLQELNFSYAAVSDADVPRLISVLQQLPALRILFLQTTGITEAGASQIRQAFPQLTFYR